MIFSRSAPRILPEEIEHTLWWVLTQSSVANVYAKFSYLGPSCQDWEFEFEPKPLLPVIYEPLSAFFSKEEELIVKNSLPYPFDVDEKYDATVEDLFPFISQWFVAYSKAEIREQENSTNKHRTLKEIHLKFDVKNKLIKHQQYQTVSSLNSSILFGKLKDTFRKILSTRKGSL